MPAKDPETIAIKVTRWDTEDGIRRAPKVDTIPLSEKLKECLLKMGETNPTIFKIFVALFTEGKVRMDFRNYIERLELTSPDDKLTRADAIGIVDEYITHARGKAEQFNTTQRIVIQAPRPQ